MRILIVEDDPKMSILLRDALEKRSHRIVLASDGKEGLDIALNYQFESIILDVMLPGLDGFGIARSLRDSKISTPIIMLTARDATSDIVRGLDSGVDDYPYEAVCVRGALRPPASPWTENEQLSISELTRTDQACE